MSNMNWSDLLNNSRFGDEEYQEEPHRPIFVQDADRISFSAPFRRLANKTQVHPLYNHDHIHHRLIHSIETSSVGRSLGMQIGHWLEEENHTSAGEKHSISSIVQAACLAHDIGNPPFGHAGEDAIGEWFEEKFDAPAGIMSGMDSKLRQEFVDFEGNAQGFRILTNLEMYRGEGGMRLSYGVLGAFTKYPTTASVREKTKNKAYARYCGLKKFGFFEAEREIFSQIAGRLGLISELTDKEHWWRRHPLVFLVEAADDICYNILDIEDAYTSGDLSFEVVSKCLQPLAGATNRDTSQMSQEEEIAYMRARGIGSAIQACAEAFKKHYAEIMTGTFSDSLVESSSKSDEFSEMKRVSSTRVFTAQRKTELEISGHKVLHRVLDGLLPLYDHLGMVRWDPAKLKTYDEKLVRALKLDLRGVTDTYSALHSLTDFVSGMTDRYTVKTAKLLWG